MVLGADAAADDATGPGATGAGATGVRASSTTLAELVSLGKRLGLACVVEAHDSSSLAAALRCGAHAVCLRGVEGPVQAAALRSQMAKDLDLVALVAVPGMQASAAEIDDLRSLHAAGFHSGD